MLAKKHEAVVQDLHRYGDTIEGLAKEKKRLLAKDHFDSENITGKQV